MERYVSLYPRGGTDSAGRSLVSAQSPQQMYRPRLGGYGLGWGVVETPEGRYLEHAGSNTTFVCSIAMNPERAFAAIVMTNPGDQRARTVTHELVKYFIGRYQP